MTSDATTVEAYIRDDVPDDRKGAIRAVRKVILDALPMGYEEVMNWGMITYQVPLAICPDTYNGKPLMYAALASQKQHMAVYLCGLYCIPGARDAFAAAFKTAGIKLDMGVSCVRFRRLEDLPLDLVADTIASVSADAFVAISRDAHAKRKKR